MNFQIKLDMFEGPLDLLLHLIREHQLDILDIPIASITEEYLRYLAVMQELDLDVAGEYLLMAATLIHIKSKMLLPPEETTEGEEAEAEDPRAELVSRLLEYRRFKEAAQTLGLLESETQLLHPRGAPAMEFEVEGPLEVSMLELLRAGHPDAGGDDGDSAGDHPGGAQRRPADRDAGGSSGGGEPAGVQSALRG